MPKQASSMYCSHCGKNVTWHLEPMNHRPHMLLSLITVGLWLPMWFLFSLVKVKYCDLCKSPLLE